MNIKKLIGLTALACAFGAHAASELYVSIDDPNASDTACEGRGTKALPYWSIQAAVTAAAAGDTVWVEPGVYTNSAVRDKAADQYPSVCRHYNRVVIDKKLTLASTQGKERTVICGVRKLDAANGYVGKDTVRCICVETNASDVIIRGFTLREGSTDNSYPAISTAGGLFARQNATLVDCSVLECAGYGTAAIEGATCVRCYIATTDDKNIYPGEELVYTSKLWNCAIFYQHSNSGSQHVLRYCDAVNCTVFGGKENLRYADTRFYNCISQDFRFEDCYEKFSGTCTTNDCTMTVDLRSRYAAAGIAYTSNGTAERRAAHMSFYHCANPIIGDFNLMSQSPAVGTGDAKWLVGDAAIITLPASVAKTDMAGNDVSALTGAINAGCSQTVRDPLYGGFRPYVSQPTTVGGVYVPGGAYLFATNWPVVWTFENANTYKTICISFTDWLGFTSWGWPYLYPCEGSTLRRMPPKTPKRLLSMWQTTAHERLWVDPANGSDETGTGTEANPYRTLACAGTNSLAHKIDGNNTIFELKPGVYKEGLVKDSEGVDCRMYVAVHGSSRYMVRAVEGLGSVTIVGSTNGTDEVRCVYGKSIGCLQGLILADGRSTSKGYAAWCSTQTSMLMHSIVTNCVSSGSLVSA